MKNLFSKIKMTTLVVGLICWLFGFAPEVNGQTYTYQAQPDTADQELMEQICKERGHIEPEVCSVTLMYCAPRYVDLPDGTLTITYDQNTKSFICQRCKKLIKKPVMEKPDTTIIWKKW